MRGYPTLKWFSRDGKMLEYDGGREESDLTTYALDKWQAELPPPEVRPQMLPLAQKGRGEGG